MNKFFCWLLISGFAAVSCNKQTNKTGSGLTSKISTIITLDTSETEKLFLYHDDEKIKKDRRELFVSNFAEIIGLPKISKGFDGLLIRIWVSGYKENYIIQLKRTVVGNDCYVLSWNSKKIGSGEYIVIHKVSKVKPNSGWDKLFETIGKYAILTRENGTVQNEREEFLTRMDYVQFEISQPVRYHFYEYLEPSFYRFVDSSSDQVFQFLEYFNNEIDIKVYDPSLKLFIEPNK